MTRMNRRGFLTAAAASALTVRAALAQPVEVLGGPPDPQGLARRPRAKPRPSSEALIAQAGLGGVVSFAAIDLDSGEVIEARGGDTPLPPASTLKSITALYALDRLGADHRFRTRILRMGDTLVLAGGGDPVLSTDDLDRLAEALVATGAKSPARFAVWGGALPRIAELEPDQAVWLAYNPTISGMILNFNRVHLGWRQAAGDYQLSLEARAERNSPRAYSITAAPGPQRELFTYSADDKREHWLISRAAMGRAGSRWLPVRQPELYAGDVFQTLCRARGLVLPAPEVIDQLPEGVSELAGIDSPSLREILLGMMRYSTNLTAEVVGLHASGATSLAASGQAMAGWLKERGGSGDLRFADHSGLSADSQITAQSMARLMAGYGATAGLRELMKDDPLTEDLGRDPAALARIEAKTGTLNFVSNLAGYASGTEGRQIAFAVLCGDLDRRAASEGKELPAGVSTWTKRAKTLQRQLIEGWSSGAVEGAVEGLPIAAGAEPEPIAR
ncbi:D-alanyl-D-alanine carboxypeptidase/D-alanyl-D-alanine endopeptidase [Paracoccus zhejiangensis]|uniref:D-alanyl-D-alanine carboxypeptidase/D-alanyl-D-alanine-endopeptidase n=1 Tax=Paracoccus zhejiangensis TaxID=1077935 RepID=A0A2H5EVF2_9RHOB|nr:D-alanyl-D-alanine carboxypeptidase/D-alanyl-D-alanine-endopeptidase [Paracoccus zhejiangensis]AUH63267.1 D-alanyl-D-alanine carboxypeptidase/D-alanyl-D-alanine-endopeptidase [Paracoccus zhejiangensis]